MVRATRLLVEDTAPGTLPLLVPGQATRAREVLLGPSKMPTVSLSARDVWVRATDHLEVDVGLNSARLHPLMLLS